MADEVKTIRIVIDSSKAVDGGRAAQKALQDIEKNTDSMSRAMAGMETIFRRAMVAAVAFFGAREFVQAIDTFTQLTNAMKVAGLEGQNLVNVQDRLFQVASKNGVEIGVLGQLYSRLGMASKELGASQDQMLRFVEGVAAALRVQGGSTEAASGALLQLSQAMGAGIVRAEEFNSILEGAFPIAQAAARGIQGMEGSVAKLRAEVTAGNVTSQKFFEGLLKGFKETEAQAAASQLTIGGGLTGLKNAWVQFAGELDKSAGFGKGIGVFTSAVGEALASLTRAAKAGDFDFIAGSLAVIGRQIEFVTKLFKEIGPALSAATTTIGGWVADIQQAFYDVNVAGASARGRLIDTFSSIGTDLERIFVGAMNAVLEAVEKGLNALSTIRLPSILGGATRTLYDPISLGRIGGGAGGIEPSVVMTNEQVMRQNTINAFGGPRNYRSELEARRAAQREVATAGDFLSGIDTLTGGIVGSGGGGGGGGSKGGGSTKAEVDEVAKLIEKIESDARRMRESFAEATDELETQNDVLALEIKLLGEAPDIRARELAILKATNEAKKAGIDLSSQEFRDRLAAVEAGEKLRIQQEEIKQSQELWTEPLKQALRDIQSIGADAFDKLLESGKFSFEELQQTFMRIIRRMAAEFLALATIRPVMSVLVNAISPSIAQSMGLGSAFPGVGGGSAGGSGGFGGGMGSLFGGGFSSMLGDFGSWLNTPFTGPYAGISPAGMQGVPMLSGAGGLTPLGALAGVGSIGMGAYSLLSGGGSTSSMIGGAASILGGGLSIAGALMPAVLGGALGPIGMGIGLLGGILPGLLGGSTPPTITNQTYGQLRYGSGGWFTNGGAWGPNANSSDTESGLKALGGGISNVFGLFGGVTDPQKVWGLAAQNKTVSGQGWSSSSDSTFLVDPSGNQQLWRMNESNMMDTGSAQVAYRSILEGAVGTITENMRKAVTQVGQTMGGTSLQAIAETVAEVLTFDKAIADLGKTVLTAEQAVSQIDQSFAAMYATADKYGLATGDVDAAKSKARLGYATDFGKGLSRDILSITDPKAAALADIEDWRTMMVDNNKWLLDNVAGAMDQIVKIEELAGLKRAAIVEQTTTSALSSLKSTIDRLLYGDLSGAAPGDVLSGTKATYTADLAKAFTGDAAAAGRLNSSSADYMQAAASYYGTSSTAYQALRRQTIIDVASAYRYQGGQFGDIPAGYDVITGNSLGGLAPSAANTNYPSLTSTNGWLGSAWSNATNAWLAANPASADISTGLAALSQQMMEVTGALQSGATSDAELAQLFRDSIAIWQRLANKIAA